MTVRRVSWKYKCVFAGPQGEDRRVGQEGRPKGRDRPPFRGRSRHRKTLLHTARRAWHPGAKERSGQETEAGREGREAPRRRPRRKAVGHPLPEGRVPLRHPRGYQGGRRTRRVLPHRDPREVHLQDRFLDVPGHALVALENLRDELAFAVPGDLQAFDLARWGQEVALVVSVSLSSPGGGELPLAGSYVLGHLLLGPLRPTSRRVRTRVSGPSASLLTQPTN